MKKILKKMIIKYIILLKVIIIIILILKLIFPKKRILFVKQFIYLQLKYNKYIFYYIKRYKFTFNNNNIFIVYSSLT